MPDPKRILLLYSNTGGGHRSAALAIREALESGYPGRYRGGVLGALGEYAPRPLRYAPRLPAAGGPPGRSAGLRPSAAGVTDAAGDARPHPSTGHGRDRSGEHPCPLVPPRVFAVHPAHRGGPLQRSAAPPVRGAAAGNRPAGLPRLLSGP